MKLFRSLAEKQATPGTIAHSLHQAELHAERLYKAWPIGSLKRIRINRRKVIVIGVYPGNNAIRVRDESLAVFALDPVELEDMPVSLNCGYCGSVNDGDSATCGSCGAPKNA